MPVPLGAAAARLAKHAAVAAARTATPRAFGLVWKAMAVTAVLVIVGPVAMVLIAFVAFTGSFSGSGIGSSYAFEGKLAPAGCPVRGAVVTQPFGPTTFTFEPPGFGYPHFHTGIDLAAPMGTPVYAASGGFVEEAATEVDALGIPIGYGNFVNLAVGGNQEQVYGHLSAIDVMPNQVVKAGTVIGAVGSTGNSTGPHLHFEVRVDRTPVNPAGALRC